MVYSSRDLNVMLTYVMLCIVYIVTLFTREMDPISLELPSKSSNFITYYIDRYT